MKVVHIPLIVAGVAGAAALGFWQSQPGAFAPTLAAETQAPSTANPPSGEPRRIQGAPLDAPVEPSPTSPSTPGLKPLGRALPQGSLDLVEKAESKVADGDLFTFDKTKDGKYFKVTFAALGNFAYEVPDPDAILASPDPTKPLVDQIPQPLKELDGSKAVVVGFMVPIEVDGSGNVKTFALTQNQMFCCFGVPPGMNEWVMVTMDGAPSKYFSDLPAACFGSLEVGEEIEDGYVMSLYRMRAEKVMDVRELLAQAKSG